MLGVIIWCVIFIVIAACILPWWFIPSVIIGAILTDWKWIFNK